MFTKIEEESRRLAVKEVADCDPQNAELILDTIQHNMMQGSELVLDEIIRMYHEGVDFDKISEVCYDTKAKINQLQNDLLRKHTS